MGMTETATRLIERFGQDAILRKQPAPRTDPDDPPAGPAVDYPVTVAVTDYTVEERANALISDSALRVFITEGVVPSTADKLVIGGVAYLINRVGTLGPDGVVICYELRVQI
ncbi:hypothetical protein [Sulfitobacter guttiformis]|jgi:hypothetical protein|uniref:Uncharacterized protein n=1 Tax=Sulfitobacter guttiformis TaxID=74349 RepID=A0A420DHI2_9RHOB|nr:hypothetical protein [Sulfitobacter guttiformis]KIN72563.1 hypothetical protein Z949_1740 [Sulfitobacter guttiformis KCTC 32187]RKE93691.1 hypothetical protein C8N30_2781 [Sulfitobacter guttiformis]